MDIQMSGRFYVIFKKVMNRNGWEFSLTASSKITVFWELLIT